MVRARKLSAASIHFNGDGKLHQEFWHTPHRKSISRHEPMLVDVVVGRNLVRKWYRHLRAPGRSMYGHKQSDVYDYAVQAKQQDHHIVRAPAGKRAIKLAQKSLQVL